MGYNCGKVMGNDTAVYQVIQLLSYYLYFLIVFEYQMNEIGNIYPTTVV